MPRMTRALRLRPARSISPPFRRRKAKSAFYCSAFAMRSWRCRPGTNSPRRKAGALPQASAGWKPVALPTYSPASSRREASCRESPAKPWLRRYPGRARIFLPITSRRPRPNPGNRLILEPSPSGSGVKPAPPEYSMRCERNVCRWTIRACAWLEDFFSSREINCTASRPEAGWRPHFEGT